MSESHYVVRPKADRDLDDQADYYATEGNPEVGHRFLLAAHDTFTLLATQPNMGWHARLKQPGLETLRVFRLNGFEKIVILYLPLLDGVEILRVVHGSRNLQALLRRQGLDCLLEWHVAPARRPQHSFKQALSWGRLYFRPLSSSWCGHRANHAAEELG